VRTAKFRLDYTTLHKKREKKEGGGGELEVPKTIDSIYLPPVIPIQVCVCANDKTVLLVLLFLSTAISTPIDYMTGIIVSSSLDVTLRAHMGSRGRKNNISTQSFIPSYRFYNVNTSDTTTGADMSGGNGDEGMSESDGTKLT